MKVLFSGIARINSLKTPSIQQQSGRDKSTTTLAATLKILIVLAVIPRRGLRQRSC